MFLSSIQSLKVEPQKHEPFQTWLVKIISSFPNIYIYIYTYIYIYNLWTKPLEDFIYLLHVLWSAKRSPWERQIFFHTGSRRMSANRRSYRFTMLPFIFSTCLPRKLWFPYIYIYRPTFLMGRLIGNGPGDRVSVIPMTQKIVLDNSLLNIQHYKVGKRVKCSNPEKGVGPFSTPRCSGYWKVSLRVLLDYGRHLYLCIYIYTYSNLIRTIFFFWLSNWISGI